MNILTFLKKHIYQPTLSFQKVTTYSLPILYVLEKRIYTLKLACDPAILRLYIKQYDMYETDIQAVHILKSYVNNNRPLSAILASPRF
jgi:hypothetical protein